MKQPRNTKGHKLPMRMCVACRAMQPKKEMLRIVCDAEQCAAVDVTAKAPGRGAYLCLKQECLERAIKIRALERAIGAKVDEKFRHQFMRELAKRELKQPRSGV